jgi:hypothetical protein
MIELFTLSTGYGSWNPVFWVIAFAIALIIGWIIWSRGERTYDAGSEASSPYLSGNAEPEKGAVHIRAGNLYWGYTDALSGYYRFIKPFHTGNTSDYLLAYLFVTAILFIVVVIFR